MTSSVKLLALFWFSTILGHTQQMKYTNSKCLSESFFTWHGVHRDGILFQEIARSIPLSSCERICRLYAECSGFNINWTDPDRSTVFCTLMEKCSHWIDPYVIHSELSFYGKSSFSQNSNQLLVL